MTEQKEAEHLQLASGSVRPLRFGQHDAVQGLLQEIIVDILGRQSVVHAPRPSRDRLELRNRGVQRAVCIENVSAKEAPITRLIRKVTYKPEHESHIAILAFE